MSSKGQNITWSSLDHRHLSGIVLTRSKYFDRHKRGGLGACSVTVTKDMLLAESDKQAKKKKKLDTDLANYNKVPHETTMFLSIRKS